jgi:tRNA threonylcarbamoyladenosine biosynthesis protein TsaE
MKKLFSTKNFKETQRLGELLAKELKDGGIIALEGDLGCGKTTFAQGFLKGLKIKGPYTSPTFLVIKNYKKEFPISKSQFPKKSKNKNSKIQNIYHIDTYRVNSRDILNLGWEEIVADKNNVIIVEWADRIRKIIPAQAIWIKFEWAGENERRLTFRNYERKNKK